jgi:UDP-glucose 4-epimerase
VPRFVRAALRDEPLEIHGDGAQTRCFCHVRDTIRALHGLLERGASGEIYNVGSANRIGILDLARRVLELTGSRSEVRHVPYEEVYGQGIEDMLHRIPSIEKIGNAVGWTPERSLDDSLEDVVAPEREALVVAGRVS